MIGLGSSLLIATEALGAQTAALEVASNNIANANTPGYSRQVVSLSSAASVQNGKTVDEGVSYQGFTSVRDAVLVQVIEQATADHGALTAQNTLLTQINSAFSGITTGIGASGFNRHSISGFRQPHRFRQRDRQSSVMPMHLRMRFIRGRPLFRMRPAQPINRSPRQWHRLTSCRNRLRL